MARKEFNIVPNATNPNLDQLVESLRGDKVTVGSCGQKKVGVRFAIEDGRIIGKNQTMKRLEILEVVILGLTREDGSGSNWNFTGIAENFGEKIPVSGFYSLRTSKGVVRLERE